MTEMFNIVSQLDSQFISSLAARKPDSKWHAAAIY